MKKFLIIGPVCAILVLIIGSSYSHAGYTCANGDCSITCDGDNDQVDFTNAMAKVADGGTISVGAGICNFGANEASYSGYNGFTLKGAGIGQTTITGSSSLISFGIAPRKFLRVTGFTMTSSGNSSVMYIELEDQTQPSAQFRVDNIRFEVNFNKVGCRILWLVATYGLVDNCYFKNTGSNGQGITIEPDGGTMWYSDFNWHHPMTYGTEYAVVIEDSTFDFAALSDGAFDAYKGAKVTFRNNTVLNTNVGWHGADSDPRAARLIEIYNNSFSAIPNTYVAIRARGGSGVIWGNTITGNYNGWLLLSHYSSDHAYGTDPGASFDGNFNKSYPNSGYPTGYPLLDQIGRGSFPGASLPNCSNGCTTANYAVSEPMYFWSNNFKGNTSPNADVENPSQSAAYIVSGRDYYDNTKKPNYTPLAYPHPFRVGKVPDNPNSMGSPSNLRVITN